VTLTPKEREQNCFGLQKIITPRNKKFTAQAVFTEKLDWKRKAVVFFSRVTYNTLATKPPTSSKLNPTNLDDPGASSPPNDKSCRFLFLAMI
jgi:hypothetical protein